MRRLVGSLVLLMLAVSFSTTAQEKETPYWYVTSYKVDWSKIDSLSTLTKLYTNPVAAQAKKMGRILDFRVLIHHTGGEYNVVRMIKYPSWAAMGKGMGWADAFKVVEPTEANRKAVNASFSWIFAPLVHIDNIYGEATE